MKNKIFNPNGEEMSASAIAEWANHVHQMSGCTNSLYEAGMFFNNYKDGLGRTFQGRLSGNLCDCPDGGEFVLLPFTDQSVIDGQKAYMQCRVCGAYSHL